MLLDFNSIARTFNVEPKGVFHVGAHHGQEMDLYDSMGVKNVVMFEPSSLNFKVLQTNVGSKAFLVNKALGSKVESAKLRIEKSNGGMSNSLLDPSLHLKQYPHIAFQDFEEVEVVTLDSWCSDNRSRANCNMMSIDVQGFELEVLMGAKQTLKNVEMIVCEVNRDELYKDCAQVIEIDTFLRYHGFRRVMTNWEGVTWGDACYIKEEKIKEIGARMPTLSLVDRNFSHSKDVLGFDSSCLLPTSRFDWSRTISNNEDLIVFVDADIERVDEFQSKHKIAWLIEPREVNPALADKAVVLADKFDVVITHDKTLISKIKNGKFAPIGGTWISPDDWGIYDKQKRVSIIASKKAYASGHSLRHLAANLIPESDRFGGAYKPIEKKTEALSDYKFSIVIENCRQPGFFTEKIVDSLIMGTVPIYWGCPDIGEFFNAKGIITFENIDELSRILESDLEEFYSINKEAIESNFKRARRFASCDDVMFNVITGVN